MKDIEKAEVDISKLFNWKKEFKFSYNDKKYSAFIRLIGDAELGRARVFALRKSAELRKKLRNTDSDEALAYLPSRDGTTKEELINGLLVTFTREFTTDAFRELKFNLPAEPNSEASLEQREKYQAEIDEYPIKRETAIREYVDKKLEKAKKDLEALDEDTLYKQLINGLINQFCENEMINKFREQCAYYGIYKDREYSIRLFNSFEDFINLPSDIKAQFIDFYFELDMDSENLKKSLVVVQ
jgi:hypothetical protein